MAAVGQPGCRRVRGVPSAYGKWRQNGIPAERRVDVRMADEATDTLLAHVKVDRIPSVVRRTSTALGGRACSTWPRATI